MKKTDPQHLLEAHIPWYQTRWFWGVLIVVQITFSIICFYLLNDDIIKTSILGTLFYATGGGLLFSASGLMQEHFYLILYVFWLILFAWNIFKKPKVKILYPLIYLATALLSTYLSYQFIFRIY